MKTHTIRIGNWVMTWQGGRLADVAHVTNLSEAVDCFEVAGWNWETGKSEGTVENFHGAALCWVEDAGADMYENVIEVL
jgi:hypothetical protein